MSRLAAVTMMRAVWRRAMLAQAERTMAVEGNHYFPPDALDRAHLAESRRRSLCPWKGIARYYDVVVDGHVNAQAAWYYPHPSPLARRIKGHVAFWNGVRIEQAAPGDAR